MHRDIELIIKDNKRAVQFTKLSNGFVMVNMIQLTDTPLIGSVIVSNEEKAKLVKFLQEKITW